MDFIKTHCFYHPTRLSEDSCNRCRRPVCSYDKKAFFKEKVFQKQTVYYRDNRNTREVIHYPDYYDSPIQKERMTLIGPEVKVYCIICFPDILLLEGNSSGFYEAEEEKKFFINTLDEEIIAKMTLSDKNSSKKMSKLTMCFQCGEKLAPEDLFCPQCGDPTENERSGLHGN
ncbi:MAG: hypothetical protein ACFFD1_04465 [Candidatus Thorarchaeota archaeon]